MKLRSLARVLGLATSLVALGVAIVGRWSDLREVPLPAPADLVAALAMAGVSVILMAAVWSILMESEEAFVTFLRSQLHKYLPLGGIVQATTQVVDTSVKTGVKKSESSWVFLWSIGVVVCSGAFIGSFAGLLPSGARLLLGGLVVAPLVASLVLGRVEQLNASRFVVPSVPRLLRALGVSSLAFLAFGASFAVLVDGVGFLRSVSAMALSWVAGFLAIPFPAGLGVRELAINELLEPFAPADDVFQAALVHRLVTVLADGVVALAAHVWIGRRLRS